MLPTPSTGHVSFDRVYEPAEDSFLLLDTLSSEGEVAFLKQRFSLAAPQGDHLVQNVDKPTPVVVEVGTGSGVVLAFVNAHAETIFGRRDVFTFGIDVNRHACQATEQTVRGAARESSAQQLGHGIYLGNIVGDLTTALRHGGANVMIFNPPYVPTPDLPALSFSGPTGQGTTTYEEDSHLLALSYAGGVDGMETTNRLLEQLPGTLSPDGVAYILLCAQNKPEEVKTQIRAWKSRWNAETVGSSGKKGGWEKLQIIRVWQDVNAGEVERK